MTPHTLHSSQPNQGYARPCDVLAVVSVHGGRLDHLLRPSRDARHRRRRVLLCRLHPHRKLYLHQPLHRYVRACVAVGDVPTARAICFSLCMQARASARVCVCRTSAGWIGWWAISVCSVCNKTECARTASFELRNRIRPCLDRPPLRIRNIVCLFLSFFLFFLFIFCFRLFVPFFFFARYHFDEPGGCAGGGHDHPVAGQGLARVDQKGHSPQHPGGAVLLARQD